MGLNKSTSICWECSNAVPSNGYGCSWSRNFEPINNWIAEKDIIKRQGQPEVESYSVKMCPHYEHMSKRKKDVSFDDTGVQNFANAVIRHALRNYADGMYDSLESGKKPTPLFIRAASFLSSAEAENYADCGGYDIDYLVQATRYRTRRLWKMPPLSNEGIKEFLKRRDVSATQLSLEMSKSHDYVNRVMHREAKAKGNMKKVRRSIALGLHLTDEEIAETKKPRNKWMIWEEPDELSNFNRKAD